jgi:hypothetical protein
MLDHIKSLFSKTKQSFPLFFLLQKEIHAPVILATIYASSWQRLFRISLYPLISPHETLQLALRLFCFTNTTRPLWGSHH